MASLIEPLTVFKLVATCPDRVSMMAGVAITRRFGSVAIIFLVRAVGCEPLDGLLYSAGNRRFTWQPSKPKTDTLQRGFVE